MVGSGMVEVRDGPSLSFRSRQSTSVHPKSEWTVNCSDPRDKAKEGRFQPLCDLEVRNMVRRTTSAPYLKGYPPIQNPRA
jgi:hypothetical protein